jgi:hypothetical protein
LQKIKLNKEAIMDQITQEETARLASSSNPRKCYKVRKLAEKNRENGFWPDSEAAIWALRAGAPQNGFGNVFLKVGRTVLVDENELWLAVDRLQEANNASRN